MSWIGHKNLQFMKTGTDMTVLITYLRDPHMGFSVSPRMSWLSCGRSDVAARMAETLVQSSENPRMVEQVLHLLRDANLQKTCNRSKSTCCLEAD